METKSSTILWPLNVSPPRIQSEVNIGILGAYPPTLQDVYLNFFGYRTYLMNIDKKTAEKKAARLVSYDLIGWWSGKRYPTKSWQAIEKMVLKDVNFYRQRKRYREKHTNAEKKKQEDLNLRMKETYWIVQPDHEKKLKCSYEKDPESRDAEDWLYLEGVRGTRRKATNGAVDKKLMKSLKRKNQEKESYDRRKEKESCSSHVVSTSKVDAGDGSNGANPEYVQAPSHPREGRKKNYFDAIPVEAALIADKYKISNRALTEMAAAFSKSHGRDLAQCKLSVNSTGRRRRAFRKLKASEIITWQLADTSKLYTLHWDGKIVKALTHVGKNENRVAVILTGTDGKEILLSIVKVNGSSTAENEANMIMQVLREYAIDPSNIVGFVFDTTATNSGYRKGVVVRLEAEFGKQVMQFACRHHIIELIGGAACEAVYGPSDGPNEGMFKLLATNWEMINTDDYCLVDIPSGQRELLTLVNETKEFLQSWLLGSTKTSLRKDYLELTTLSLIYLGGTLPEGISEFNVMAPGAYHHARWMAIAIYTIKIAMYQHQLQSVYTSEQLQSMTSLAIFLCIFYTKPWLTSSNAADAPVNDLNLFKSLLKVEKSVKHKPSSWPSNFNQFISLAANKMYNHLWYTSERLVPLAFMSDKVPVSEKEKMRRSLLQFKEIAINKFQEMPKSADFSKKTLKDFIGNDSWTFFSLLGIDTEFLQAPVSQWEHYDSYLHCKEVTNNLPVVNDAAERALGLVTEMNTQMAPKSEEQRQALYKVVKGVRQKLREAATSTEVVTKKALCSVQYIWE